MAAAAAVDDVEIPQNFYNIQNDRNKPCAFVVPQLFYTTLESHVSILFSFHFFFGISFVNQPFHSLSGAHILFLLPALGICIHSRIGSASVLPLFIFRSSWRSRCLLTRSLPNSSLRIHTTHTRARVQGAKFLGYAFCKLIRSSSLDSPAHIATCAVFV